MSKYPDKFYTYLWLRADGTPYYAGKGIGRRAFKKYTHRMPPPPNERIIIQEFECEEDAFFAEKFLIAFYGREDLGEGKLLNYPTRCWYFKQLSNNRGTLRLALSMHPAWS